MTLTQHPLPAQIPADLLDEYRDVPTSIVSDCMDRLPGLVGPLPYHRGGALIGTALTVRTRSGDNLAIHEALKIARPGDVIVVDGGGDLTRALIGEIIMEHARALGLAGIVIDGALRDVGAIRRMDLPCYARAVTHRGPYKNGPGILNAAISVGGDVVMPGDLVLGDEDGVVTLTAETARRILPQIRAKEADERTAIAGFRKAADARRA